jgi:DNA processing protein
VSGQAGHGRASATGDPVAAVADGLDVDEARTALALLLTAPGPDPQRRAIAERLETAGGVRLADVLAAMARRVTAWPDTAAVEATAQRLAHLGARLRLADRPGYPPALMRAWPELGAPAFLVVQAPGGRLPVGPAVAVVGTRSPTLSGLRVAERLAGRLAEAGVTVVSGLARGIDTAAHRGALAAGGPTVGVAGAGLAVDYPRNSAELRREVAAAGGLLGELAPATPPARHTFVWRNRIISGLAEAAVVVEGGVRSGALHTARMAAGQGRDVWAVPGPLDAATAAGPLALVRDGAQLVTDIDDVVASVAGRPSQPRLTEAAGGDARWAEVSSAARRIGRLLGPQAAQPGELARAGDLPVAEALVAVGELAAAGLAHHTPRGVVVDPDAGAPPAADGATEPEAGPPEADPE